MIEQFFSKAERLKFVFGGDKFLWNNAKHYCLITSPHKPVYLKIDSLPTYLKRSIDDMWFQLDIPDHLIKITRCDETGKPLIIGSKWKVERT